MFANSAECGILLALKHLIYILSIGEITMNMTAEIKRIKAEKKELLARQRQIKEKLNETKEERKQARSLRALARKEIKNQKSKFRQLTARINTKFSELESNEIEELAEELRAVCDELVISVESFGKASAQLEI